MDAVRLLTAGELLEEQHVSSRVRGKWHAFESGNFRGVKPIDNVPIDLARGKQRATPAAYVDERNLRLKRRYPRGVKLADTP
ncbi:hypothetical protein KSZ_56180 [Dictyobacter formicarum]|uniref:Transposase n=1 Tax=Dictyobacter formicarum TaxID=2778368 RepID=A0ABQ3VN07_9CHLR|nr:hypothetical protein KSZ_56180 [Dictyobacter formicarum]